MENQGICSGCGLQLSLLPKEDCNKKISLFEEKDDTESAQAIVLLRRMLPDRHLQVIRCPPSMRDQYHVPFIRNEKGIPYFGMSAIVGFIRVCIILDRENIEVSKPSNAGWVGGGAGSPDSYEDGYSYNS